MKKLTILLFSILISFNSYGKWKSVTANIDGISFYIETDTIKEHGRYVYYWRMSDNLKPDKWGDMSVKMYNQGDCAVNRHKPLSTIFYKQPMGGGNGEAFNPAEEWVYPSPGSVGIFLLNYACNYVK